MRKMVLAAALMIICSGVQAGALFDDYLNYVRPGTGTGPGDAQATVTAAQPVGQSFTVPAETGEVYRIGVRPVYETWGQGEQVTMTLYDSPQKGRKLGSYTIDHATCRVSDHKIGNGSQFQDTKDYVLYYQFRTPTEGHAEFYFELSAAGGDGKVAFQGFGRDAYPGGHAHAAGTVKDVAFECHIKPVADREANLRRFFGERLDITRPELAAVKAAVDAGDWEQAIAETVEHFHNRMELWEAWKDVMQVKIDSEADTSLADLVLKDQVRHADTKQPIPWRKESWWAGEIPDAKKPHHGFEPSPYTWHTGRQLAGSYTATGREEYARRAIDLMMQFILDNPSPKTSGLPWYFEVWNDRTAGARTPGHGDLVYARLYNYKGWANDEKLIFLSFIEDNAHWDYQATSGANWGAEAARAAMEFGIKFPEWKMSPRYTAWGAGRLAEISVDTIRGDGVSTEAAIKYHAMVARRLKGMLEDHFDGKLRLEDQALSKLMGVLERVYDHMAHTLQPNNYVVMCGDSWYEDYSDEVAQAAKMVGRKDLLWIATQGKEGEPPSAASKVYPAGGYFIMRSGFGGEGLDYADARQLFIHNGGWWGAHGHWDFTSINLYGYGRTLVVDPGQYDYTPPPGIDPYWVSRIHSMMVMEGRDVKREPGPSEWVSNSQIDWFDGIHYGYNHRPSVDHVRRRVAFMKPNYFLVDDSAKTTRDTDWTQVWNLSDPSAKIDASGTIETTFLEGGNLMILNQDAGRFAVEQAPGITATKDPMPDTRIFRLTQKTADPRFQTLLYPFRSGERPEIKWERILPDDAKLGNLFYSLRVSTGKELDWAVFGAAGTRAAYRKGSHVVDADFAAVRMSGSGAVTGFSWANGSKITFSGKTLAEAGAVMLNLAVEYDGARMTIEAAEPDSTLTVATRGAKSFVVNGEPVEKPVVMDGMLYPFAHLPRTVVADDRDAFVRITDTNEWTRVPDPGSYSAGFTHHETDPGRHETGDYVFAVPKSGAYRIEAFHGELVMTPSDRVEYRIVAPGRPAAAGGAVVGSRIEGGASIVTVNQQEACGWVSLGEFELREGDLRINARNATEIDGLYFIADAVRLVEK